MKLGRTNGALLAFQLFDLQKEGNKTPYLTKVMGYFDSISTSWLCSSRDRVALRGILLALWHTQEANDDPETLAEKQRILLDNMDRYPSLRVACLDLSLVENTQNASDSFEMFMALQAKVLELSVEESVRAISWRLDSLCTDWACSEQERAAIKACFLGMWDTSDARDNPQFLAEQQLTLLGDMHTYAYLRLACLDLAPMDSPDSAQTAKSIFPLLLELQSTLLNIIKDNPSSRARFTGAPVITLEARHALVKELYDTFLWKGNLYHRNHPFPCELVPNYKNQPYLPITDVPLKNLNGLARCIEPNLCASSVISCAELATQYIKDALDEEGGSGKVDMCHFATLEAIPKHITPQTYRIYAKWISHGLSYDLIHNDKLGEHLGLWFDDMQSRGTKLRAMFVHSFNHAMAVVLRKKGTEHAPVYVVKFYEPMKTGRAVRFESVDPTVFKSITVEQCITGSTEKQTGTPYNSYYKEGAPYSIAIECGLSVLNSAPDNLDKKLGHFESDTLTPTHIYFLLEFGLAVDLASLRDRLSAIGQKSADQLLDLLRAEGIESAPGLYMAMQRGFEQVISVFGQLMHILPGGQQRLELLSAKSKEGRHGLVMAIRNGHSKVVLAYREVLQSFPDITPDQLVDLVVGLSEYGYPALYSAFFERNTDAVDAYTSLFELVPDNYREKLFDKLLGIDQKTQLFGLLQEAKSTKEGALITWAHLKVQQVIQQWKAKSYDLRKI